MTPSNMPIMFFQKNEKAYQINSNAINYENFYSNNENSNEIILLNIGSFVPKKIKLLP